MVGMVNSGNAVYTLGHSIKWGSVRYIAVAKYDTAANPKWVSYLGDGLHNFKANSIYSCKDGSILVNGLVDTFFWDSFGTGYYVKDDFYVIKLDSSNGYPLSIVNVSEQLRTGIVIYPNPAQEELHIKGAVLGSVASIYNSVGQLMMQETIRSSDQVVPIQQLASGNYLYQINDKNGQKLSSGKWIKR
jgi:hypothetical protein